MQEFAIDSFSGMNAASVEEQALLRRVQCRAGANFNRFLNPRIYRRPTLSGLFKTFGRHIRRAREKHLE